VTDDSEREHARVADEARRTAREAGERAREEAERITAETTSGESGVEQLRQLGVIYGGLIGVATLMVQPFLNAATLDVSARVSVIAFPVAAFVGIVAGFWHITPVAGVTFHVTGLVAVGVHSAGFWRVESPRRLGSSSP
jgi:hypothetical protein